MRLAASSARSRAATMSGRRPTRCRRRSAGRPNGFTVSGGRHGDGEAAVGPLAHQRGEAVAGQQDLLVERLDVGLRGRRRRLRLLQLGAGVEAVLDPHRGELGGLCAVAHRLGGGVALGAEAHQVGVGAGDGGGERQPRLGEVRLRGLRLRHLRRPAPRGSCRRGRGRRTASSASRPVSLIALRQQLLDERREALDAALLGRGDVGAGRRARAASPRGRRWSPRWPSRSRASASASVGEPFSASLIRPVSCASP